jgi:hypothetical protein
MKRTNFKICIKMLRCVLFVVHLLYSTPVVHSRIIMSVTTPMIYKKLLYLWNMEFPVTLKKYQLQNGIS